MPIFLFTDIEGSTRLWEQHTAEMGAVIARHDALLQRQITACGGRITKHTGDGITAAFEDGEPLSSALETQVRFADEVWGAIGELRIRVGLHAGAAEWIAGVEGQAGDYHGPPVNCTARIMSAAWGGQILLTPEVSRISHLPPGATLQDLGEHLLKNVSAPQQIYQLVHPDLLQQAFPPPRTLSGQSIRQAVDQQGAQMARLPSSDMAVALVSATLLPTVLGDLGPDSPALAGNIGVLRDMGAAALAEFLSWFAAHLPVAEPEEVRRQLEAELRQRWAADAVLRRDASRLLQAVQGVDATLAAATGEVKEALARGLAGLGSQFDEFRWVLGDVQEMLAEMRRLQHEQLDVQLEQLARTEELLALHQEPGRPSRHTAAEALAVEPRMPAFVEEGAPDLAHRPVFVARERELAWLEGALDAALVGQGGVVFVTGGPGRGKTALLNEFAGRAMDNHTELLVANGTCNAYSGVGDPYLPFREVLGTLSGDVEDRWAAGAISRDHALRLWRALPAAIEALLDHGPHLSPALVPGGALLSRAWTACPNAPWLGRLRERVERGLAGADGLEQSHLFQQVSNVLRALSETHPLLLILDDLQWVDHTSAGLLFHLGRRMEGARILIAGTYRPEEVAPDRQGEPHPLEKVLAEFKRTFGDVWLDLAGGHAPEGRRFVDALLATEPNCLGEGFRQALAERAAGHPLFTVELLRAMQERGDLVRDEDGRWTEGPALDWDLLPARVEGAIGERIERLEDDLREILSVACVEGEDFTAEVVAQVQSLEARALVRRLSGELQREHRLVRAQGLHQLDARRLALYRFQHHLFQKYLYNNLDPAERAYLHEDVGTVLEALYGAQTDEVAVQLARHFLEAGVTGKAAQYLGRAGVLAAERYANEEAIAHLSQALEHTPEGSPERLDLLAARAKVYDLVARYDEQRADLEAVLALADALEDEVRPPDVGRCDAYRCDALIALAKCLHSTQSTGGQEPAARAAEIARVMGDPLREGLALCTLASHEFTSGQLASSRRTLEAALARLQETGQSGEIAACMSQLARVHSWTDQHSTALDLAERAVALSRKAGDLRQEATSLRGVAIGHVNQGQFTAALPALEAALALHRQIGDRHEECHGLNVLGRTLGGLGRPEEAARVFGEMLKIAEEVGTVTGIGWGVDNMVRYVLYLQGEFEAGLSFLQTWLVKARQGQDEGLTAWFQLLKASLLLRLGQLEPALQLAQKTLPDIDQYGGQRLLLLTIGLCQAGLGRFRQAGESFRAGLDRSEEANEAADTGGWLLALAYVTYLDGDQAALRAAMKQVEGHDIRLFEDFDFVRSQVARLHLALGNVELALESSSKAIQREELLGDGCWLEQYYLTHARVLRALGRDAEADGYLQRAYDRVMLVASKTQDDGLRQGWLENVRDNREIVRLAREAGLAK